MTDVSHNYWPSHPTPQPHTCVSSGCGILYGKKLYSTNKVFFAWYLVGVEKCFRNRNNDGDELESHIAEGLLAPLGKKNESGDPGLLSPTEYLPSSDLLVHSHLWSHDCTLHIKWLWLEEGLYPSLLSPYWLEQCPLCTLVFFLISGSHALELEILITPQITMGRSFYCRLKYTHAEDSDWALPRKVHEPSFEAVSFWILSTPGSRLFLGQVFVVMTN